MACHTQATTLALTSAEPRLQEEIAEIRRKIAAANTLVASLRKQQQPQPHTQHSHTDPNQVLDLLHRMEPLLTRITEHYSTNLASIKTALNWQS